MTSPLPRPLSASARHVHGLTPAHARGIVGFLSSAHKRVAEKEKKGGEGAFPKQKLQEIFRGMETRACLLTPFLPRIPHKLCRSWCILACPIHVVTFAHVDSASVALFQ
jgi:hypothetical protein